MAENIVELLTDVADAIREKKGSTEPINAQNFSDEIRNIPSGSPFAVDFGEEIATGNAAYINALQEDIDYYNEIQRKRASGELTDTQVKSGDISKRLAWVPKGLEINNCVDWNNLIIYDFPDRELYYNATVSPLIRTPRLSFVRCKISQSFTSSMNIERGVLKHFEILNEPKFNGATLFAYCYLLQTAIIPSRNITNFQLMFRDCYQLKKVVLDLESASNVTNMFFYSGTPIFDVELLLSNVGISLSLSDHKRVTTESVKFILDHCQAKEEPYTLTLNSAVKTAFLAKCDEDAEYAASLASANAKGLTLA